MTQREKTLATGLVVALGLAASAAVLFFFVLEPLKQVTQRLDAAQGKLDQQNAELQLESAQIDATLKVNPRLKQWADISLSPRDPKLKSGTTMTEEQKKGHIQTLQVDYEKFLSELLVKNRFKGDSISIQPAAVEKQKVERGKQPTYERLAFSVTARGDLESVQGMLKEFYQAPLLHQVRTMTVELPGMRGGRGGAGAERSKDTAEGELDLKMTVQALLATGAKDRATLQPDKKLPFPLKVLADSRPYELMLKKNMFTGIKPVVRVSQENSQRQKSEPREEVLRFVKLTMLCFDPERKRWEATVYDQAKGGAEKKLNARILNELTIYDRYNQISLDAKVVYIDDKQLIFKEQGKYYRMYCGDFIYPAISQPLTTGELEELGITP